MELIWMQLYYATLYLQLFYHSSFCNCYATDKITESCYAEFISTCCNKLLCYTFNPLNSSDKLPLQI
jgi:hypothetical protein